MKLTANRNTLTERAMAASIAAAIDEAAKWADGLEITKETFLEILKDGGYNYEERDGKTGTSYGVAILCKFFPDAKRHGEMGGWQIRLGNRNRNLIVTFRRVGFISNIR